MTYILKITLQTLRGMCKILKGEQELYMCVSMCTFVCVCICVCAHFPPTDSPQSPCTLSIYCLLLYITLTAGTRAEAPVGRGLLGCLMWWTGIVWNPQTEVTSHWPHPVMAFMTPQLITFDLWCLILQHINRGGSEFLWNSCICLHVASSWF